jgi:hypothetical protein
MRKVDNTWNKKFETHLIWLRQRLAPSQTLAIVRLVRAVPECLVERLTVLGQVAHELAVACVFREARRVNLLGALKQERDRNVSRI